MIYVASNAISFKHTDWREYAPLNKLARDSVLAPVDVSKKGRR